MAGKKVDKVLDVERVVEDANEEIALFSEILDRYEGLSEAGRRWLHDRLGLQKKEVEEKKDE